MPFAPADKRDREIEIEIEIERERDKEIKKEKMSVYRDQQLPELSKDEFARELLVLLGQSGEDGGECQGGEEDTNGCGR